MSELYAQTLKYFHLAIFEFLPRLKELQGNTQDKEVKEELENLVETYDDIASKIDEHNLNYDDPNRRYDGEPAEVDIDIPNRMIENLARLSHRLLLAWKEKLEKLKKKTYLTDKNKEESHKLENLIWPLEALLKAESYVLGKYAHLGSSVFPGELLTEDTLVGRLTSLLEEIRQCYALGDEELLESQKLTEVEDLTRSELGLIVTELTDESLKLKYKKLNGGLRNVLKSGFHNRKTAESKLDAWRVFIEEIIENSSGSKPLNEAYFSAGQSYDAMKVLRGILNSARATIWIEDNFLHPKTISIVEPYVVGGNVSVKFLTRNNGNSSFNSFRVDVQKFKSQYSNLNVEARENSQCHDRYVIVDGKEIYHSGHSFHDLGSKASQINKVEDGTNKGKILSDFEDWWNTGHVV